MLALFWGCSIFVVCLFWWLVVAVSFFTSAQELSCLWDPIHGTVTTVFYDRRYRHDKCSIRSKKHVWDSSLIAVVAFPCFAALWRVCWHAFGNHHQVVCDIRLYNYFLCSQTKNVLCLLSLRTASMPEIRVARSSKKVRLCDSRWWPIARYIALEFMNCDNVNWLTWRRLE